jgi:GMP synthase-like glutamine amidotransferase
MRPAVLIVQNAEWEGPGLIKMHARAAGIPLVTVELFKDARVNGIPLEMLEKGAFAAVVALGSPSTAYLPSTDRRRGELVELFKVVRKLKVPSFNICYSMQLFSLVHGGSVTKNPLGKEVGFYEVSPTEWGKSDPVIGDVAPYRTLQWHGDIVEKLPAGSILLASSNKTKNQLAVLDGIHYLVQADGQAAFPSMVRSWLRHDADWAMAGTGMNASALIREAVENQSYFRNSFLRVFANFFSLVLSR